MSSSLEEKRSTINETFGFRYGATSVHTSRTMMLAELSLVLEHSQQLSTHAQFVKAIVDENVLGKPTQSTRIETARKLTQLYTLDPKLPVFRVLTHFFRADKQSRPMLAYLAAAARDPLLRQASLHLKSLDQGCQVTPTQISAYLNETYPQRFKSSTAVATAQRLLSTWAQAGFLTGKVKKLRDHPTVTPVIVTYAFLLAFLSGVRGKMLFDSIWVSMLDCKSNVVAELASDASKQGWMTYKAVGSVIEVTFPGLLTSQEERASNEQN